MEQYISKSALVAKIDDWRDKIIKGIATIPLRGRQKADAALEYEILGKVRDFIDTLEVKEVDTVWHDASEPPKGVGDKEILVQFADSHASVLEIDDWEYLDHQTKWAYLKDLI